MAALRTPALLKKIARLEVELQNRQQDDPRLALLKADPGKLMGLANLSPDPWQEDLLRSQADRMLLLCSRQAGKSTVAAALAVRVAVLEPGALILLLSPTLRQSGELFRDKVVRLYTAIGKPVPAVQQTALTMALANGSRIISLPGDEKNIRGYSGVSLLIVDEASRVADALYYAIRPMLAVSRGRMVCLSTPFGKRGWFHEAWTGTEAWDRFRITAQECPRISAEFLAEERRALGQRWFAQEYECSFEDAVDQVFAHEDIMAALNPDLEPLLVG